MRSTRWCLRGLFVGAAAAVLAARAGAADPAVVIRTFGSAGDGVYGNVGWGGDLDGDGHGDVLLQVLGPKTRAYSGRTSAPIRDFEIANPSFFVGTIRSWFLGDLNGDGVPEVGLTSASPRNGDPPGMVFVFSGETGAELYRASGASQQSFFGTSLVVLGDVNGDGVSDFVVSGAGTTGVSPGEFRGFSGKDGAVIPWLDRYGSGSENLGRSLASLGDINGDDVGDFAVGAPLALRAGQKTPFGRVDFVSGKDGKVLRVIHGKDIRFGQGLADAGDVDHDGRNDLAIAGNGVTTVAVYSSRTGKVIRTHPAPAGLTSFGSFLTGSGRVDLDGDRLPELMTVVGSTSGSVVYVLASSRPSAPIASVQATATDFIEGFRLIPDDDDDDADGVPDLLVSVIGRVGAVAQIVPVMPSAMTFRYALTRPQSLQASDARGTFGVTIARGRQTAVVSCSGLARGTTYTVHLETGPGTGAFTQVGSLVLHGTAGSLTVTGTGTPPAELGISSLADLMGRLVELRDGSGTTVLSGVLPFPASLRSLRLPLPLARDPASPHPAASGTATLTLTPKTGSVRLAIVVRGVPRGTPLRLEIEDAPGSGVFLDEGAFTGTSYVRDTSRGQALPGGGATLGSLSGRRIRVLSGTSVVLSATMR